MNRDKGRSLAGAVQSPFWVLFGSIWLLVGLPFVLLAGYFLVQERQLATTGRVVEAMVLTKDIGGSGDNVNRSVTYRFTSADGQTIEGRSEVGESIWNSVTERGPVRIAYLPNRPAVNHVVGIEQADAAPHLLVRRRSPLDRGGNDCDSRAKQRADADADC